jgi:hypothetical protein
LAKFSRAEIIAMVCAGSFNKSRAGDHDDDQGVVDLDAD